MEWLGDATNALEQEDSLLSKGLLIKFFCLHYNRCFFSKFKILYHMFVIYIIDRTKLLQMIVSNEFLKHCEREAISEI